MKKVLIAVDETKGSAAVLSVLKNLVRPPQEVLLLYVQRLEGRSLMIDMLSEAELDTLKESIRETDHKERLDENARKILDYYKKEVQERGLVSVRSIIRQGIPSDEILRVADEENVDLIIVGSNEKKGLHRLITGCVSKEVERSATVPVLVAKTAAGEKVYGLAEAAAKA